MNRIKKTATVVSLGLIAASGGPALGEGNGDLRVEMIEFPGDSAWNGNLRFSGDGSTTTFVTFLSPNDLYVDRGEGWVHRERVIGDAGFGLIEYGRSDNGEVIGTTNFTDVSIIDGLLKTTLPRNWRSSDIRPIYGRLQGRALSGDGRVVGMDGAPNNEPNSRDALLWSDDDGMINISQDLPQERVNYQVKAIDEDGSVAVFGAIYQGPHNNIKAISTERDAWVWNGGELIMIPAIDPGYDIFMRVQEVSGNGEAVIGIAQGSWRPGFGDEGSLNEVEPYFADYIDSPYHAWIWTQESGTIEIEDPERFDEVYARSITNDASIVLGNAWRIDSRYSDQFLWYGENDFVIIDDLIMKLGISIDADWYSFHRISGDGSMLMGVANRDGRYYSIKVTIPVR